MTATYPGEMLVVAQGAAGFATAGAWTTPNGMQEESVQSTQPLAAGALADQALTPAGATGPRTITFSSGTSLMGIMVALRPAQPVLYYHGDQLGSTRVLTDSAGVARAGFTFDSYGNLTGQSGTAPTPLLFNGQYRDAESGLYYLRARYFDSATGQFLSRDPAVATTRSAYGYVGDNPLNHVDPLGLAPEGNGVQQLVNHYEHLRQKYNDFLADKNDWYGSQCPRAQRAIENHYRSWKGYQKGLKTMLDNLDLEDPAVLNDIANQVDPNLLRLAEADAPAPTSVTGEQPVEPAPAPSDGGGDSSGGAGGEIGIPPFTGGHHSGMAD